MTKAQKLQETIDRLRKEIADIYPSNNDAIAKITARHSEIFVAASQLAEVSTKRIVYLSWALLMVSVALLAIEVGRIVFHP
jgi:hypothetical protein